jgi:hypothetical protein
MVEAGDVLEIPSLATNSSFNAIAVAATHRSASWIFCASA